MLIIGFLDRFLDFWGLVYIITVAVKIALGYPVKRWFY